MCGGVCAYFIDQYKPFFFFFLQRHGKVCRFETDLMLKLYSLYIFFDSDYTQRATINTEKMDLVDYLDNKNQSVCSIAIHICV